MIRHAEPTHLAFLARAAGELNRSLDYEATLSALARLAVPAIADWCAVDIVENGVSRRLAVAHVDPAKIALVHEIQSRYTPRGDPDRGLARVLRTGEPEMVAEIPPELLDSLAHDDTHLAMIRQLGLRSYIIAPIRRGTMTIGALTLVSAESNRLFDESDLVLATTLAERAAIAIENARLFAEVERARAISTNERDRLYQLVMEAPVAIAILRGPDLVFEVVNEHLERIFGGRRLLGLKQADLDPTGAHGRALHRAYATGKPVSDKEREITHDWDGTGTWTTRYFDYTVTPILDEHGSCEGVFLFTVEVTEQIATRKKVNEARSQAELANRAKDEFLAMLGHELRNPLAPILTALHLMELRAPESCGRERAVIERQVNHVVRLVEDLLDVSRITSGKVELRKDVVDLAEVLAKAIETASPLLEQRSHMLELKVPNGLRVFGDQMRLTQVFANLVTNAAKYTEPEGRICITGERAGGQVVVRVRDTGSGIAPEMLPLVFDMFVQERQSIDRAQGGLGLGLAIVRSLVRLHGGEVSVASDGLGKGSEFVVQLPAVDQPVVATRAPRGTPAGSRPLRPEHVLVVDDNPDALEMLAEGLEECGFTTSRAHDGPSALEIADKIRPQVALLDLGLPVMDGYELARRLRERYRDVMLIAVTGYGHTTAVTKSQEAGFGAHLVKPITLEVVRQAIERLTSAQPAL